MTKQELIEKAYGDAWEVLSPYIDVNGWVRAYNLHKYDTLPLAFKVETIVMDGVDWYRPMELSGINDNNGWTKIESENDLPKEAGLYLFLIKDSRKGPVQLWFQKEITMPFITHWRPIVEIPKPLY